MTTRILSSLIAALTVSAPAPATVVAPEAEPTGAPATEAPVAVEPATSVVVVPETSPPAPAPAPGVAPGPAEGGGGETVLIVPATATGTGDVAIVTEGAPAQTDVTPQPVYRPIVDPLPAPPAPLSRRDIRTGPWRGRWWFGLRLGMTGPLGGEAPARPSIGSITGGFDLGFRVNNMLGIGTGLTGQLHDSVEIIEDNGYGPEKRTIYGDMVFWDPLFVRVFVPLRRRFQPFAEIGGGLAAYDRAEGGHILGGQVRSGVGFEGWLTPNLTLGVIGNYRWTRLTQKFESGEDLHPIGHSYQALAELGFHW